MLLVPTRLGGQEYLGALDTGATTSILAKKGFLRGDLKNIMPTGATRIGDGHVVHSCGDCEVDVPTGFGSIVHPFYVRDTKAFHFLPGGNLFTEQPHIQSLTLQAPNVPHVKHPEGRESEPLEQSKQTSSCLRVCKKEPAAMMVAPGTEDYPLLRGIIHPVLKELGYSQEDHNVELFASDTQHVLDLNCCKGCYCCYKFYWPSFGVACGNPRFSELGKVLTKVALEHSRMVLCSPDSGAHGENDYWRTLLQKLTLTST